MADYHANAGYPMGTMSTTGTPYFSLTSCFHNSFISLLT